MTKHFMTRIATASIGLGNLPFNLFAEEDDSMILVFKAGSQITTPNDQLINKFGKYLSISSSDQEAYLDYTIEHITRIIVNSDVGFLDKVRIVNRLGMKAIREFHREPHNKEFLKSCKKSVDAYVSLIIQSRESAYALIGLSSSDAYSFSHALNVGILSILIGMSIYGADKGVLWRIGLAGMTLDIGKSIIDDKILSKHSGLSDKEWELIKQHPIFSYQILSQHDLPESVMTAVKSHHERFDGSGYPEGLRGKKIHPFARILAVTDVYDAITSEKSYGEEKSHINALKEMSEQYGKYDSEVFDTLLEVILRNELTINEFKRKQLSRKRQQTPFLNRS